MGLKLMLLRSAGKVVLTAKNHAPQLLMLASGISGVAALVAAGKGTLKFQEVLEKHNHDIEELNAVVEKVKSGEISEEKYSLKDARIDRNAIYIRTFASGAKIFAPTLFLAGTSFGCALGAVGIVTNWYKALGGIYVATLRDKEKLERENDRLLKALESTEDGARALVDIENDNTFITKQQIEDEHNRQKLGTMCDGRYAKFFDESNPNFEKDAESNRDFLQIKENYCNFLLNTRGFLFLNDVLEMLGMEKTQAGQIMGWKLYKDAAEASAYGAENCVDFGLKDAKSVSAKRFIEGLENVFLVQFNVDKIPIIGRVGFAKA